MHKCVFVCICVFMCKIIVKEKESRNLRGESAWKGVMEKEKGGNGITIFNHKKIKI